jgi:hypothetical protein
MSAHFLYRLLKAQARNNTARPFGNGRAVKQQPGSVLGQLVQVAHANAETTKVMWMITYHIR